jgi:hypothetical protein
MNREVAVWVGVYLIVCVGLFSLAMAGHDRWSSVIACEQVGQR